MGLINQKMNQQKGFSLIEVLITVIITSVTLAAVAVTQIKLFQRSNVVFTEDRIAMEVDNMFEYIRANPPVDATSPYVKSVKSNGEQLEKTTGCDDSAGSTKINIAEQDLACWQNSLVNINGVTGFEITEDKNERKLYTIRVTFKNDGVFGSEERNYELTSNICVVNYLILPVDTTGGICFPPRIIE